ncbi:hypothetical protein [Pedobacter nanyangensis]|uniref:hypothetical protein n=1 Tax=Pedobacter nanyangensis TaxID=1562389 RepID=UPI001F05DFB8|nr:hypothetical protein [Pedobacter nanyangensis]
MVKQIATVRSYTAPFVNVTKTWAKLSPDSVDEMAINRIRRPRDAITKNNMNSLSAL